MRSYCYDCRFLRDKEGREQKRERPELTIQLHQYGGTSRYREQNIRTVKRRTNACVTLHHTTQNKAKISTAQRFLCSVYVEGSDHRHRIANEITIFRKSATTQQEDPRSSGTVEPGSRLKCQQYRQQLTGNTQERKYHTYSNECQAPEYIRTDEQAPNEPSNTPKQGAKIT